MNKVRFSKTDTTLELATDDIGVSNAELIFVVRKGDYSTDEVIDMASGNEDISFLDEFGEMIHSYSNFSELVNANVIFDYIVGYESDEPIKENVLQLRLIYSENIGVLKARIAELEKMVEELTPYTETKIGYYGETEKTFYDVPEGNVSVFFDNYHGAYTTSRQEDRLYVYFDALEKETNITISIM